MNDRDIEILAKCTACGRDFTPSHSDYVRGVWRICPPCRDGPTGEVSGAIEP